ncbi:MAG: hypothetical protein EBV77_04460 [Gemmatimonadaceae bacterium]|nr:hypothetical protein [Gemmatimonadaceae bacterium]
MFRHRFRAAIGAAALFALPSFASPLPAESPVPSVPREFRGARVASGANIDWPSKPGLSAWQQQSELLSLGVR